MSPETELTKTLPHSPFHPVYSTAVLSALLLLALAPVVLPLEIAKWYIAAAQNSLRKGELDRSESLLEQAVLVASASSQLPDHYYLHAKILEKRGLPDESIRLLKELAEQESRSTVTSVGNRLSDDFFEEGDLSRALMALEEVTGMKSDLSVNDRNMLAYLRALNKRDLIDALKEVDIALAKEPQSSGILDTKAWVLHQMGRNQEAKPLMEKSLQIACEQMKRSKVWIGEDPSDLLANKSIGDESLKLQATLTTRLIREARAKLQGSQFRKKVSNYPLFQIATLRYHYAKILEGLGETEGADEQWSWLNHYSLDREELLY